MTNSFDHLIEQRFVFNKMVKLTALRSRIQSVLCVSAFRAHKSDIKVIREIKFDVTWSYVKRQTAKMTSEFVFFSSNPSLNHIKIEKCLLLFATNANIFTLLLRELKTDGKSFIFAVCSYTYDHVTANLISQSIVATFHTPVNLRVLSIPRDTSGP